MRQSRCFRVIVTICFGMIPGSVSSKEKPAPTYDQEAVLIHQSGHYDYSASSYDSTTGQRYDSYCVTTETSISCSDDPGGGNYLVFADRTRAWVQSFPKLSTWHRNDILYPNPLYGYYDEQGKYVSSFDQNVSFRFVVDRYGRWTVCVPYKSTDRHDRFKKEKEFCYDSEQPHH